MSGKLSLDKPTAFGKIAISFFFIKYCLYEIFNISLSFSTFPRIWKNGRITGERLNMSK